MRQCIPSSVIPSSVIVSLYVLAPPPITCCDGTCRSRLAEVHAKLSLRSEAIEEDGVMAILLYEESLASRYGHSVLNVIPAPHFRNHELSDYLGNQVTYSHPVMISTTPSLPSSVSPTDESATQSHSPVL